MRIGIEINGVLRDTLKKIQQEYEKWYLNENWKEMEFIEDEKDIKRKVISDVTSLDLKKHLEFLNLPDWNKKVWLKRAKNFWQDFRSGRRQKKN